MSASCSKERYNIFEAEYKIVEQKNKLMGMDEFILNY